MRADKKKKSFILWADDDWCNYPKRDIKGELVDKHGLHIFHYTKSGCYDGKPRKVRITIEEIMMRADKVKVGQIWRSNDTRDYTSVGWRKLKVISIAGTHALVKKFGGNRREVFTTIRLDRFKPTSTGYIREK